MAITLTTLSHHHDSYESHTQKNKKLGWQKAKSRQNSKSIKSVLKRGSQMNHHRRAGYNSSPESRATANSHPSVSSLCCYISVSSCRNKVHSPLNVRPAPTSGRRDDEGRGSSSVCQRHTSNSQAADRQSNQADQRKIVGNILE
jgi:hypothetical protein